MSLFAPAVTVTLNDDELERVTRPIVGPGGAQDLLRLINERRRGYEIELDDEELIKVHTYANHNDGSGGHQGRFKAVLSAAWRAGWRQP